jgi:hypothetical protein
MGNLQGVCIALAAQVNAMDKSPLEKVAYQSNSNNLPVNDQAAFQFI